MDKEFSLGQILSIYHGVLMCEMSKIYEILDFMTGDSLFTHQLPRAAKECTPYLGGQFPWLCRISLDAVHDKNSAEQELSRLEELYGKMHQVKSIPSCSHEIKDPLAEIIELNPNAEIIVI